jgi:DNA end-binding protein Ku
MREAGKVGIGKVVLRSKQQLCALRPTGDVLTLTTMLFGDEVLAPDRLDEFDGIEEAEASGRELSMAQQLISSLSSEFDPSKYRDEYRERVLDLIERKAAGEEIAVQPQAEEPVAAPDLMAALEASLAAVEEEEESKPAPKKASRSASKRAKPRAKAAS